MREKLSKCPYCKQEIRVVIRKISGTWKREIDKLGLCSEHFYHIEDAEDYEYTCPKCDFDLDLEWIKHEGWD